MGILQSQGVGVIGAEAQVTHELMPQYVKSLKNNYKQFVMQTRAMSKNSVHREISDMLAWYEENCGYSFEKAMKITLRKKRRLLEEILAEDSDDDGSDEDDEEGDDEAEEGDDEAEEDEDGDDEAE